MKIIQEELRTSTGVKFKRRQRVTKKTPHVESSLIGAESRAKARSREGRLQPAPGTTSEEAPDVSQFLGRRVDVGWNRRQLGKRER